MEGGYSYSPAYFSHLLREKLGMFYYKPEPRDYRQPEDAEYKLQERIKGSLDALKLRGKNIDNMLIGFADESAAQFHNNNARFWCLEQHIPRKTNSEFGTQKFFGFYALNGNSIIRRMTDCKSRNFQDLLLDIKKENPGKEGVILFWDNAKAHIAVEQWAFHQDIFIINLPPYSPNLNPIERVWKSCKRWVNESGLYRKINELASAFENAFHIYKTQLSFATSWIDKMSSIFSWNNPIFDKN
jgi:transposase